MIPVFFSPAYVGSSFGFDTTRKAKWVADSLAAQPIPGLGVREPRPLARQQLTVVHDADYIRAVETGTPRMLAESQGFSWDPNLWPMVLASNGGVLEAAFAALQSGGVAGSLSSGLHHARSDHGAGFCTFNGLAVAARAAVASGVDSVLILDLDAHCGGGTHSLVSDATQIWHLDLSVSGFDAYTPSERCWLGLVDDAGGYLALLVRQLKVLEGQAPRFGLCLYNAGMDPCERCSLGGLRGITGEMLAERERIVFEWCRQKGVPVAFVLAGGYIGSRLDQTGLVNLHRLTLSSAARAFA